MNIEDLRIYCLSLNSKITEDFPFDKNTLVFRIGSKIFALLPLDQKPPRINLKCDPEDAISLREEHAFIMPGYHMNKKHWNTVIIDENSDISLIKRLIQNSYQLIYHSLPKKTKDNLL